MAGNASEVQIAAFLIALRTKGETVEEIAGLARTMRELAAHVEVDHTHDDLLDVVGTGGGRPDVQRLDDGGADRRRRRLHRRQARQPLRDRPVGRRRRAGGARRAHRPRRRAPVGRCVDEVGFGFMFAPTHHAATRYVIPVRRAARRAHDLQLPRAADEPGRRHAPADGRRRPPLPRRDRRRVRAARRRARARRLQRRRARRAVHLRAERGRRGARRRAVHASPSTPPTSASTPPSPTS